MRIALDASCLASNGRGFARYVQCLLAGLDGALPPEDALLLFSDRPLPEASVPGRFRGGARILPPRRLHALWRARDLPRAVRAAGADLLHLPDNAACDAAPVPLVATVHDISPVLMPRRRLASAPMRLYFRRVLEGVRTRARSVIAVSERDRLDLHGYWRKGHPPLHVVLNGIPPPGALPPSAPPSSPYFLFVGALEARKNLRNLVEGYRRFRRATGLPHRLVLVGAAPGGPGARAEIPLAADGVECPGALPVGDPRVAALYRGATALALVSWYETFGFPYVEAMAYDCPVLGTTAGSGPEVVADAGLLADPADPDGIASALARLATEPDLREELVRRGRERAKRFTARAMAEGTLAVYRGIR